MTARHQLLEDAITITHGDRNEHYDTPSANFRRIADLWSIYLGTPIEPHDVAAMNVLQKVARLMHSPLHRDSWLDIAGYAACGYETLDEQTPQEPTCDNPPSPTPEGYTSPILNAW